MCTNALWLDDGNDRDELFLCLLRIKFWVLILLLKGLDNLAFLSYNTTPAEEGCRCSLICLTTCLSSLCVRLTTYFGRFASSLLFMCLFTFLGVFLLCRRRNFWALLPPKTRPHDYHSILGFDHIFDHKQNRSTRRQECTRVWKSRFCVAERARKSKNG